MQSHRYEFTSVELLRHFAIALTPLALFALVMQAGARWSLWPPPRPALDTERTVLLHQADACRRPDPVELLLLGDSSCLMNVSARRLEEQLGRPALNLGTFSFLDLQAHSLFLREFTQHHARIPQAIVLLLHPEALRRLDSDPYYLAALTNYWAGRDHCESTSLPSRMACLLGVEIFRGRWLGRLPTPLPGAYGTRYGFSSDLEKFMTRERGSAVDPEEKGFEGNTEYRLAPTLEKASRAFRSAVPSGSKLIVGITPAPARFAGPRYPSRRAELLRVWGAMLQADALLTNLPPVLPDEAFVRTTHLRESTVPAYTDALAETLRPLLPD